ncbi:hypothetical protein AUEXF2481DRAFT_204684 [Aureobasidium subglaciale EXF-2481]|uniref:Uncharacterized protein n=1 Tax=Aureobasidium subglaciale (strain EXF-2481) TaxID=1043005 RepID=A0A074YUT5_AURSE|nr:uncharacterized protein AUEXF2481DRAFT_204684 [Aureobasidium subglaciale EXF-2481]KEQ99929.1 hypothetical protein AUEXF2481DRAFT_204684 [Aureobasidium subglaciale EXF-2481]
MVPIPARKRTVLEILGFLVEYSTLKARSPATVSTEETERINHIDFLCSAYELPKEVRDGVLEYHLPQLRPIDITVAATHQRPSWCITDHAEFMHWRHRRLIFRTDDLDVRSVHDKVTAAQNFITNVLFDANHPAHLPTLGQGQKKIMFQVILRADLAVGGMPVIEEDNLMALWAFLHVLNGQYKHIKLAFVFKDSSDPNNVSSATKREIAPDDSGPLAVIKQNMLSILLTAMIRYAECLHTDRAVPPAEKWKRYLPQDVAADASIPDIRKYHRAREYTTFHARRQVEKIFHTRQKQGFLQKHMCDAFGVGWPMDDTTIKLYTSQLGEPHFPLDLGPFMKEGEADPLGDL